MTNMHHQPLSERESIELAVARPIAPLPPDALRLRCNPNSLPFQSTAGLEPVAGVIGQDAAMEALRFGLEINAPGQNIFVRGLTGTGRMTLVRRLLEEIRLACPLAKDRCYVHNFSQPDHPRLITLPRGRASEFCRLIDDLVEFMTDGLESALSSEGLPTRRTALDRSIQQRINNTVEPFEQSLKNAGLALASVQVGEVSQPLLLPLIDGKPVKPEDWEQMRETGRVSDQDLSDYQDRVAVFQPKLRDIMLKVNDIRRDHVESARTLRGQAIRAVLEPFLRRIRDSFADSAVDRFLNELVEDVASSRATPAEWSEDELRKFRVHVLVTHDDGNSCPIIVENNPTMGRLLGAVDYRPEKGGFSRSDHLMIRPGSLLRADGGYLILEAREVLREPGAWKVLVRTLRSGTLEIVPSELSMPWWGPLLKPEPSSINVKVVLLGDLDTYYLLDRYDPDFAHLFKVLADFDTEIPRNDQNISQYAGVLARIAAEEGLLPFDRTALAWLVEYGSRIAGRQRSMTARFGRLADIAREASFLAGKKGQREVKAADVRDATIRSKRRGELPSLQYRELLRDGTIRVILSGTTVGQVNGLAVTHAGPMTYGFPARITATIGPGSTGVINIERESDMSGSVHTKGFYILGGLMRFLLRTEHPLTFNASIAFEQSYGGIDGDSASGAEICCLLSSLTGVPLRQDLAMTGAIDQVGNILAIGAANEKIEGFFDACNERGLTGTQGVMIPKSNAGDLMLREDVVEACAAGRFHVYTVETVHEALELLTGVEAGTCEVDGFYPENTLLGVAVAKAFEYWVKAVQGLEAFTPVSDQVMAGDSEETPKPPALPGGHDHKAQQ